MTRTRRREEFFSVCKSIAKSLDDFAADLITTWTSRSSNRNTQIPGARVIFLRQTLDTCQHRRGQSPTPAGMHCRKSTSDRITQQNRNAIRSLDPGQHALRITDDHVTEDRIAAFVL